MPEVVNKIFLSLTLKPGQWKTILGIKVRNVSSRAKQLDLTITNLEPDKRVKVNYERKKEFKILTRPKKTSK